MYTKKVQRTYPANTSRSSSEVQSKRRLSTLIVVMPARLVVDRFRVSVEDRRPCALLAAAPPQLAFISSVTQAARTHAHTHPRCWVGLGAPRCRPWLKLCDWWDLGDEIAWVSCLAGLVGGVVRRLCLQGSCFLLLLASDGRGPWLVERRITNASGPCQQPHSLDSAASTPG